MSHIASPLVQQVVGKIISWRIEHHINQSEFAAAMTELGQPWHQPTMSRLEKGRRDLSLDEAVAVADILGLTLEQLVEG